MVRPWSDSKALILTKKSNWKTKHEFVSYAVSLAINFNCFTAHGFDSASGSDYDRRLSR